METNDSTSGENDMSLKKMELNILSLLRLAFSIFITVSLSFLVMAIFDLIVPRSDSLFGFFLCGITGLMFKADQIYRRSIFK